MMEYNKCETCLAGDGRAGTLFGGECLNCADTRILGKVTIHKNLRRTPAELQRTCAILGDETVSNQLTKVSTTVVYEASLEDMQVIFAKELGVEVWRVNVQYVMGDTGPGDPMDRYPTPQGVTKIKVTVSKD